MTAQYDVLLSDGRTVEDDELDSIQDAVEDGLCEIAELEYVLCSNPKDPDYEYISDRNCKGRITPRDKVCPKCTRRVTEYSEKSKFVKKEVKLDFAGIRNCVRDSLKQHFSTNASTTSKKYCDRRIEYVIRLDSPDVNVFILGKNSDRELIKWIRLYDENPVLFLVDSATSLSEKAEELQIPSLSMNDIYPSPSSGSIDEGEIRSAETTSLSYRGIKGALAHELGSSEKVKERMGYDDFERICQNLLVGSIGNSQLLGSSEAGSGVPDGTFSLHYGASDFLYMWDAKYVDYEQSSTNETTLSDEYDKIFRHLKDMENRTQIERKFGEIQGIVLFSPGIKESNIGRLAEFIEEQELLNSTAWNGTVIYFPLESLLDLYDNYRKNIGDVKKKEESLRLALHTYLSSVDKHSNDPAKIAECDHKCDHISRDDVALVFEKVKSMGPEESHFDVEEHMEYLDLIRG